MTDIIEGLPHNIQSTIDSRLAKGEELLVSLPGGMGEALAVTARKLFLAAEVREPGRPAREEVLDFLLGNIEKIAIEETPTGGNVLLSLKGDTSAPPISFPAYKKQAFEAAVEKVRELLASAAPAATGTPAAEEAARCQGCGMAVEARFLYCPGCGIQLRSLCQNCNAPVEDVWGFCTVCGRRLDRSRLAPASPARAREMVDREGERPQERQEPPPTSGDEDAETLNDRGTKSYEAGRIEEAVELFKRAIELEPEVSKYHINLGVAYGEAEGKEDDALACYRKAAELDPRDPSPHLLMGYLFNETGDPESARAEWEQVAKLAPGTAEAKEAQDAIANLDRL
jgi:tetratricopeptide (TPR) repeat protein